MSTLTDTDGALITGDTFIWKGKPALDRSSSVNLVCAGDSSFPNYNRRRRPIIEWDLSGTALMGSTINTAKINFDVLRTTLSASRSIEARLVLRTDMDWTNTTWTYYKSATPWQVAGATGANDSSSYLPAITLNGPTSTGSWDYTGLAFAVQDAIDSRSGFLRLMFMPYLWSTLYAEYFTVRSVDYSTGSSRPTLIVDYTATSEKRMTLGTIHKTSKRILAG